MNVSLILHASLNIANSWQSPSLIMRNAGSRSLLEDLLVRLEPFSRKNHTMIVCSDNPVDDPIVELCQKFSVTCLRVAKDFPFALEPDCAYLPTFWNMDKNYGFFRFECFEHYAKELSLETCLVGCVDELWGLNCEFLDELLKQLPTGSHYLNYAASGSNLLCVRWPDVQLLKKKYEMFLDKLCQNSCQLEVSPELKEFKQKVFYRKHPVTLKTVLLYISERQGGAPHGLSDLLEKHCLSFFCILSETQLEQIDSWRFSLDKAAQSQQKLLEDSLLSYPGYVEMELTNECQLQCSDCPHTVLTRPKQSMSWDMCKQRIQELAPYTRFLSFSGNGEPTLYDHVNEAIGLAKNLGIMKVCMETNGYNLRLEDVQSYLDNGLDILILNLDALSEQNPQWESFLEELLALREHYSRPVLICLQLIYRKNLSRKHQEALARWEYVVDAFILRQHQPLSKQGQMPHVQSLKAKTCAKTQGSMIIHSNGHLSLCSQSYNQSMSPLDHSLLSLWQMTCKSGGTLPICANCEVHLERDNYPLQVNRMSIDFVHQYFQERVEHLQEESHAQLIRLKDKGQMEEALQLWQDILRYDPSNTQLDELFGVGEGQAS